MWRKVIWAGVFMGMEGWIVEWMAVGQREAGAVRLV